MVGGTTSNKEGVRELPMEETVETQAEESCCPVDAHSEPSNATEADVNGKKLEIGLGEASVIDCEGAAQIVKQNTGTSFELEGQMEESTSKGRDSVSRKGDGVQEPESGMDQQLGGAKQTARNEENPGSIHDRLGQREAESSDWRRGKRERPDTELEDRSERTERRNGSISSSRDAGRKRRKSGDGRAALPLSPEETCFRMGAVEDSRGSPKFGRDKRRERYQPPRAVNEEDQRATLYVGDIEQSTSKRDLRGAFQRFGEIKEAKMITNQCYGFVTFRLRADAESALESVGSIEILGRKPYVSWAQGAMPAWKIGVGGFVLDPSLGIVDKRDALSKAAEVAAGVAAAAVRAKQKMYEENVQKAAGGRSLVAYDDLF